MSKYFSPAEFKRCDPPCSIEDMRPDFLAKLDRIRERAKVPMVINSAYRSPAHERAHGRSGAGDHPQGRGVDIRTGNSAARFAIVKAALEEGIMRIGIGRTYVHLGDGRNLPESVIWDYYE